MPSRCIAGELRALLDPAPSPSTTPSAFGSQGELNCMIVFLRQLRCADAGGSRRLAAAWETHSPALSLYQGVTLAAIGRCLSREFLDICGPFGEGLLQTSVHST